VVREPVAWTAGIARMKTGWILTTVDLTRQGLEFLWAMPNFASGH
jgi:hypothetical protein